MIVNKERLLSPKPLPVEELSKPGTVPQLGSTAGFYKHSCPGGAAQEGWGPRRGWVDVAGVPVGSRGSEVQADREDEGGKEEWQLWGCCPAWAGHAAIGKN